MIDSAEIVSLESSTDPTLKAEAVDAVEAANGMHPNIDTGAELATENNMAEADVNVRISHLEEAADQATVAYEMITEDTASEVGSTVEEITGNHDEDSFDDNNSEDILAIHEDITAYEDNYNDEYANDEYADDDYENTYSDDSSEMDDYTTSNEESHEEYTKHKSSTYKFNERMSSDEAHRDDRDDRDDSTEDNDETFSEEKPKIEVMSKTNGIEVLLLYLLSICSVAFCKTDCYFLKGLIG